MEHTSTLRGLCVAFFGFYSKSKGGLFICNYGQQNDTASIFVFGLPYQTNRISINSEHDIINVRLLSICPPTAYRPYFQEGSLVGTYDVTTNFDTKTELDFSNRLIAKFEIPNDNKFWGGGFHKIPKNSLYPDNDPIFDLCQQIKKIADKELKSGDLGEFLKSWAKLEERLVTEARNQTQRFLSVREAMRVLYERQLLTEDLLYQIDRLRTFRNTLVHKPQKVTPAEVKEFLDALEIVKKEYKITCCHRRIGNAFTLAAILTTTANGHIERSRTTN